MKEENLNRIEEIDKNFAVKSMQSEDNLKFYDACSDCFYISGLIYDTAFRRMPEDAAKAVSEGVYALHTNTAGGSVHFNTNSRKVAIRCILDNSTIFPHMPLTGKMGFDMYANNEYYGTFIPPIDKPNGYESVLEFSNSEDKEITINFPLYNNVSRLYIGLDSDAYCHSFNPYKSEKPIVYYGSSITQGGCASRPGMCYENIIARNLGYESLNLGFSGSALGEDEMARYIASLNMSVFVFDYDHNAPNAEHLKNTHEKFYLTIRDKKPDLPIIMLCQHNTSMSEAYERRQIIIDTYNKAKENGDNNVYFIDGFELFPNKDCTVDGCHPTDLGFSFMAEKIGKAISKILEK